MATFFEPPAFVSLVVVLASSAGALYYGLRPALRGPLPVVTSERDEVWGVEDPPTPPKRPYVYPARPPGNPVVLLNAYSDGEPEPHAIMPAGPTVAPTALTDHSRREQRSHAAPDDAPTQD